jgi:hypothetical protein
LLCVINYILLNIFIYFFQNHISHRSLLNNNNETIYLYLNTNPPHEQLPSSHEYKITVIIKIKNPITKYTIMQTKLIVRAVIRNPLFFIRHGDVSG